MKRSITKIVLLALSVVLTLTLVFGLYGCGPRGPEAFTAAESAWNSATNKKAVDNISFVTVLNLGEKVGTAVTLTVELELTREYKGHEIKRFAGVIKKISITGISSTISSIIPTLTSTLGITLPENVIDGLESGSIVINNPAEGSIVVDDDEYVLSGSLDIELFDLEISTDDLDEDITYPVEDLDAIIDEFGLNVAFDMLTLYDFKAASITKDNTISFTGEDGLDHLISQAATLIDSLFEGELTFNDEEVVVPQIVIDIVTAICGSTDSDDIKDFIMGPDGLVDLGNVNMSFTYEGDKFNTITGTQTMGMKITKAFIEDILEIDAVETLLEGANLPIDIDTIINLVFGTMVKVPTTIEADITVTFTTTYDY